MSNNTEYKIISSGVAPIYNNPSFSSEIINQALFWEELICIDVNKNWHKVKQRDGYIGWVHSFYTSDSSEYVNSSFLKETDNWYFVIKKFIDIDLDDKSIMTISFGSLIPCIFINEQFKVIIPNGKYALIDKNLLVKMSEPLTINNIIHFAKSLLNTPYLWGGRSSFGFDCSGFIQLLLSLMKVYFPRDTKNQINYEKMFLISGNYKQGDIIFFSKNNILNHVGIFINEHEYIHSSGYVKINSINSKQKQFDKKLYLMIDSVHRLDIFK